MHLQVHTIVTHPVCWRAAAAAKMAVYGYFATLATEVADSGVSVTICCPGPVAAAPGAPPRSVYGATGIVTTPSSGKEDKARISPDVRRAGRSHAWGIC